MKRTVLLLLTPIAYVSSAQAEMVLVWPLDCTPGETCEVQHYVDHGVGSAARDYRCGSVTYKGHNGTDIRVPFMNSEQSSVSVLAAAAGRVLRARDDVADISVGVTGRDAVKGRECGNGLVIAHADGFETQYCHMARGSVLVKPGETVVAGQKLGRVGLSGDTEFPHLHITVRRDGKVVDPFAVGQVEGACSGGASLWDPASTAALSYQVGAVLNAGFSDKSVLAQDIDGRANTDGFTSSAPAIIAFARAIALRRGDVQRLTVSSPVALLIDHTAPPLPSDKDQVVLEAGRKRPATNWPTGIYTATYSVTRDEKIVVKKTFSMNVEP